MGKRKRIKVDTVEDRIYRKKREYARMIMAEKQVSFSRAMAKVDLNLRLGLADKGVFDVPAAAQ